MERRRYTLGTVVRDIDGTEYRVSGFLPDAQYIITDVYGRRFRAYLGITAVRIVGRYEQ